MLITLLIIVIVILLMIIVYLYRRSNPSYDGNVIITKYPDGKTLFSLDLDSDPYDIHSKGRLVFKVVQESSVDSE